MTARIVEFGSHPYPEFIADDDDFQTMLDAPVDGSVIRLKKDDGTDTTTIVYNATAIELDDLGESITFLQTRNLKGWGKCNYNFIEVQLTNDADLDWFDEDNQFAANMITLAKVAACTGVTGICFDVEDYSENVWWYDNCRLHADYTFEQYQEKVYDVAQEIAAGWQSFAPDIKIFFTFAYDGYIGEVVGGGEPAPSASWGLYKDFLDGIHDYWGMSCAANNENALIKPYILTTESSYAGASYVSMCRITGEQLGPECVTYDLPYTYTDWFHLIDTFGLAYWPDNSFSVPYNNATPNSNSMTPAELKQSLVDGLSFGANFQWIYNQNYHFFNSASILNAAYITAMEEWREDNGLPL